MMKDILTYWQLNPVTISVIVLVAAAYMWLWKFRLPSKTAAYIAFFLLLLCMVSPLQTLSAYYLFSAHMVVHVVLLLIVAPLLVMGLPDKVPVAVGRVCNFLEKNLWFSWFAGIATMWFWHIPVVFNAMAQHTLPALMLHFTETLSIIISGMLFSYPVISAGKKIHPLIGVLYLFTACTFCSLLGLMITFAPEGIYNHYLSVTDAYHLNNVIQTRWRISRVEDRQAAGLIMWVPCCMVYVSGALYLLKKWFDEKEYKNEPEIMSQNSLP